VLRAEDAVSTFEVQRSGVYERHYDYQIGRWIWCEVGGLRRRPGRDGNGGNHRRSDELGGRSPEMDARSRVAPGRAKDGSGLADREEATWESNFPHGWGRDRLEGVPQISGSTTGP
jgi:hypothetical protein